MNFITFYKNNDFFRMLFSKSAKIAPGKINLTYFPFRNQVAYLFLYLCIVIKKNRK